MRRGTGLGVVVAVWLGLVAWRPLVLGFYHDDWWSLARPITLTRLSDLLEGQGSRALLTLMTWCLRHLFDGVAAAWQILATVANLACAVLIATVVERVSPLRDGAASWAAAGAGAFWLAVPWSLAYTAWPVMSLPLLKHPAARDFGDAPIGAPVHNPDSWCRRRPPFSCRLPCLRGGMGRLRARGAHRGSCAP